MDFSLKESLGLMVALVVGAMVIGAFLHFGLFQGISDILQGVI